jgi:DNA topoisomerase-1
MKLVIVESPAKAQTINKYLGNDYKVMLLLAILETSHRKMGQLNPTKILKCLGR